MSHIVTIQTRVTDCTAVATACARLGLAPPAAGTAKLFSGEATGLLVGLPGWQFPLVIDTTTGTMRYDNFAGRWGEQVQLDRFLQRYAVEKTKLEARKKGYTVTEQALADGSIRVQLREST